MTLHDCEATDGFEIKLNVETSSNESYICPFSICDSLPSFANPYFITIHFTGDRSATFYRRNVDAGIGYYGSSILSRNTDYLIKGTWGGVTGTSNDLTVSINGVNMGVKTYSAITPDSIRELYLNKLNAGNYTAFTGKIYSFKILGLAGLAVKHNFVPAYQNTDLGTVPTMYDTVTGIYMTANGNFEIG
jgi:hypothetical protein